MTYAWRIATRCIIRTFTRPQLPVRARIHLLQRTRHLLRAFHQHFDPKLENQTCKLSDGRTVGFAEYGTPRGTPAFFFHGAPGCRYDGFGYHEPAKKLGVRIICPDRPGHGLSSPYPGRTLSSYAKDISDLARHLEVDKYHVFGQSGGGPYAVACAYAAPPNELLNATVVAGMGHPNQLTRREAGLYTLLALGIQARFPNAMQKTMDWWYPPLFFANDKKVSRALKRMYMLLRKEDRALMEQDGVEPVVMATLRAAFAQGSQGAIGDCLIYYGPWDFELKDVRRKVQLIFGDGDNRTPLAFGRYYEKYLPDAELEVLENCSHFSIGRYADEILAKVVEKEVAMKERDIEERSGTGVSATFSEASM